MTTPAPSAEMGEEGFNFDVESKHDHECDLCDQQDMMIAGQAETIEHLRKQLQPTPGNSEAVRLAEAVEKYLGPSVYSEMMENKRNMRLALANYRALNQHSAERPE